MLPPLPIPLLSPTPPARQPLSIGHGLQATYISSFEPPPHPFSGAAGNWEGVATLHDDTWDDYYI